MLVQHCNFNMNSLAQLGPKISKICQNYRGAVASHGYALSGNYYKGTFLVETPWQIWLTLSQNVCQCVPYLHGHIQWQVKWNDSCLARPHTDFVIFSYYTLPCVDLNEIWCPHSGTTVCLTRHTECITCLTSLSKSGMCNFYQVLWESTD